MKKLILTLLLGGLIMTGAFAQTAFVYFSATGTTERMAKNAAKEVVLCPKNCLHLCRKSELERQKTHHSLY